MSHYGWAGPGELRPLTLDRANAPEVEEPESPDMPAGEHEKTLLHVCTVEDCGRRFKKRMILARHFNASHEDLREDSDTWREYADERWE